MNSIDLSENPANKLRSKDSRVFFNQRLSEGSNSSVVKPLPAKKSGNNKNNHNNKAKNKNNKTKIYPAKKANANNNNNKKAQSNCIKPLRPKNLTLCKHDPNPIKLNILSEIAIAQRRDAGGHAKTMILLQISARCAKPSHPSGKDNKRSPVAKNNRKLQNTSCQMTKRLRQHTKPRPLPRRWVAKRPTAPQYRPRVSQRKVPASNVKGSITSQRPVTRSRSSSKTQRLFERQSVGRRTVTDYELLSMPHKLLTELAKFYRQQLEKKFPVFRNYASIMSEVHRRVGNRSSRLGSNESSFDSLIERIENK